MNLIKNGIIGGGLLASLCSSAIADLKLPAFFSDRMVLQQETGANIWGWADAGQEVKVSFAGQTETANADKNGKWKLTLKDLKTSKKGAVLSVSAGDETKQINDVLVGEVWIASGQSNMEWPVSRTSSRIDAETAKDDLLRVYVSGNKTGQQPLNDFGGSWKVTAPENTQRFTAVGYEFAKVLREKLDVPVGVIECAWGGKPVDAFVSAEALKALPEAKDVIAKKAKLMKNYNPDRAKASYENALEIWKKADADWKKEKKGRRPRKPKMQLNPGLDPQMHSNIYNGMIAPIAGYSARGAIWYQGESNSRDVASSVYGELLECLIHDWRKKWDSNLSFYYVQLANFKGGYSAGWVSVQDEMRRLLDDEDMKSGNIGMATINDIGAANDIHPTNKKDVGARLARWALKQDYGMKNVVVSGPLYLSHEVKSEAIELTFKYGKGLKARDGKALGSFEIAGSDGVWKTAEAKIVGGKVVVSSKEVAKPAKARYAWNAYPIGANLVNAEGLPTSCFETK